MSPKFFKISKTEEVKKERTYFRIRNALTSLFMKRKSVQLSSWLHWFKVTTHIFKKYSISNLQFLMLLTQLNALTEI